MCREYAGMPALGAHTAGCRGAALVVNTPFVHRVAGCKLIQLGASELEASLQRAWAHTWVSTPRQWLLAAPTSKPCCQIVRRCMHTSHSLQGSCSCQDYSGPLVKVQVTLCYFRASSTGLGDSGRYNSNQL